MSAIRIYATNRPSHSSAPVVSMDREQEAFWTLRKQGVPSTSQYLRMKGLKP